MKSKPFFLRLQLFTFILVIIFLGLAAYFLPQKNHLDLTLALNNSFRTQYHVVRSIEQLETGVYVYQRALVRWAETGSPLWAELVSQSRTVVEKRLDDLEQHTQSEAANSILSTVAQLQGQLNDYFSQASDRLSAGTMAHDQTFLNALASLELGFQDSIQNHTASLSMIFLQRAQQTRWALGLCAGLMVLWAGLIAVQMRGRIKFEIRNSKFEANPKEQKIQKLKTEEGMFVDLILPCHLQTYDFERAAAAVFNGERIKNGEEEENTEKTRLLELESTTPAEDEVLKEVDEILAREIPGVDLQGSGKRRQSSVVSRPLTEHGRRNTDGGIQNVNDVSLAAPAANDYPDVVIALHQEDFIRPRKAPPPPTNAEQLYAQTSLPDVRVVNGEGEEVIQVDFDQERNDLAQRFKKKMRR